MKVSRRHFLTLASLGVAGVSLTSVPQFVKQVRANTSSSFPQPPDEKNEGSPHMHDMEEFSLRASRSRIQLPGSSGLVAELMTYNDSYPGPTLRVKEGDRVRINLQNDLDGLTNLHLHGLHVSPEGQADNIFRAIQPGETALIEFSIPKGSAGTYWYHPHYHGNANSQLFAGLSGTIIVYEPLGRFPDLQNFPDYLVVLKDLELDAQGKIPPPTDRDWMNGREGSLVLINGAIAPTLQTENALIRLRLLNQSPGRYYNLMIEKHSMIVIATDGGFVNAPYPVDSLLLAPGERYEVLVNFKQRGDFSLMNMPYARGRKGIDEPMEMDDMDNMQNMDMTTKSTGEGSLMTLRFTGSRQAARIPERLNSIWALNPKDAVQRRTINFTENMGMLSFSFNGKEFDPNRVDIRAKLGTVEIWELINNTNMDHPFHLNAYPFQVYARNGKPEPQPAWKDVVNVKPKETVQILIPFKDFTGKTVFHCHVLEHEERGMMGAIEIVA